MDGGREAENSTSTSNYRLIKALLAKTSGHKLARSQVFLDFPNEEKGSATKRVANVSPALVYPNILIVSETALSYANETFSIKQPLLSIY